MPPHFLQKSDINDTTNSINHRIILTNYCLKNDTNDTTNPRESLTLYCVKVQ